MKRGVIIRKFSSSDIIEMTDYFFTDIITLNMRIEYGGNF